MYYMVLLIMYDLDRCPRLLDAWEAEQVPGITILESTGLGTLKKAGIRDDLPLLPSLSDILRTREQRHRTIFTVVEDEATVDRLIELTQEIVGNLNRPENGVLFVLPVARVVGLKGAQERARGE